jgi:hypothetical protein
MHLAKRRWQAKWRATLRLLLQENYPARGMLVQQPAKPQLLEPQDSLLLQAQEIPQPRVRARPCLRGPDPFAFFRETPDVQKCNRAARCGDSPISARYRRRCNRRGLVDYGNRRSRLPHKRVRLAGTFPIAGVDKCPFLLRRIED